MESFALDAASPAPEPRRAAGTRKTAATPSRKAAPTTAAAIGHDSVASRGGGAVGGHGGASSDVATPATLGRRPETGGIETEYGTRARTHAEAEAAARAETISTAARAVGALDGEALEAAGGLLAPEAMTGLLAVKIPKARI